LPIVAIVATIFVRDIPDVLSVRMQADEQLFTGKLSAVSPTILAVTNVAI